MMDTDRIIASLFRCGGKKEKTKKNKHLLADSQ